MKDGERSSAAPAPAPRRGGTRRARRLLLVLGLALALPLAAWALRGAWLVPWALSVARERAREQGLELSVARVRGDLLGELVLEGVRVRRTGGSVPLVLLEGARIEARYSLPGLLAGGLAGLEEVRVSADALELDLAAESAPARPEGRGAWPSLPSSWPALGLELGSLALRLPAGLEVAARDVALALGEDGALSLRSAHARLARAGVAGAEGTLVEGALAGSGRLGADGLADVDVELRRGPGEDPRTRLAVADGVLELGALAERRMAWRGTLDLLGGGGPVRGGLGPEGLDLGLELADLELSPTTLPQLLLPPAMLHGTLDLRLDGGLDARDVPHADFALRLERPAPDVGAGGAGGPGGPGGTGVPAGAPDVLAAEGRLDGDVLVLAELALDVGRNRLRASDLGGPLDVDRPWESLRAASGRLTLEAHDLPRLLGRSPGDSGDGGRAVPEHELRLAASLAGNALELTAGELTTPGGRLVLRRGSIRLPDGMLRVPDDAPIDVELDVAFEELSSLGEVLGIALAGGLDGDLRLGGTLGTPRGGLELRATGLTLAGRVLGDGAVRAQVQAGVLRVAALELAAPAGRLAARGRLELATLRLAGTQVELDLADAGAALELALGPDAGPRIGGRLQVHAELAGPLAAPEGPVRVRGTDLSLGAGTLRSLELSGRLRGRAADELRLEVRHALGRATAAGRLAWPGGAEPLSLELDELALERGERALVLAAPARASLGAGGALAVGPLRLAGSLGAVELEARRGPQGLSAELLAEELELDPLLAPLLATLAEHLPAGLEPHPGVLDGRLLLDVPRSAAGGAPGPGGTEPVPSASVALRVRELAWAAGGPPWELELEGELAGGVLELGRLRLASVEGAGATLVEVAGRAAFDPRAPWPPPPGPVALELRASTQDLRALPLVGPSLPSGAARLAARLGGTWQALEGELSLEGEGLVVPGRDLLGPLVAGFEVELGDEVRLVRGFVDARGEAGAEARGSLALRLDLTLPPAELAAGVLDAPLALDAELDAPELADAGALLPAVRRLGGGLAGELRIGGSLREPQPVGTLQLTNGSLRLTADLPAFQEIEGSLALEEEGLLRLAVAGEMGGAPVRARGTFDPGEREGEEPRIELDLSGEEMLLRRTADLRLRADADLHVEGPLSALVTTGDLLLSSSYYARDVELLGRLFGGDGRPRAARGLDLSFFPRPPLADMRFDVAIRSKEPFLVENNVVDGAVRPELRLGGTGAVPVLIGRVFVDPTRVSLPSGTVQVGSGVIEFREEDPFFPVVDLVGEMRIRGYDIRAHATGPYDALEIQLSSSPSLPNDQLLVLFLTGELPRGSETGLDAARSVGVYLAKDLATRWLSGDEVGGDSVLERLEFDVGADLTRTGAPTAEVTFFLDERTGEPGRVPYITAERDVYDKVNFGIGLLFRFD